MFQKTFLSTTEYHDICIKIVKHQCYMKKDMHGPLSTYRDPGFLQSAGDPKVIKMP